MYRKVCQLAFARFPTAPSTSLPPLSRYPATSPEHVLLAVVHAWANSDWPKISSLSRTEFRDKHSAGGTDDFDDPLRWLEASLGWGKPVGLSPFTREQLSAGIVRLQATITLLNKGAKENRVLVCKIYPQAQVWRVDMDHCSMQRPRS
jgi:hypothetical protein